MNVGWVRALAMVAGLATTVLPGAAQDVAGAAGQPPVVSPATTPAGTEALSVRWVRVSAPGVGVLLAAVARPDGAGPFPAVLILHGTHGFAREYVQLAKELSRGGVIGVAACWFSGGGGAGARVVSPPIPCPDAPALRPPPAPDDVRIVDALVSATRMLPGVRADRVGLVGHSRGAGATLYYVQQSKRVQAAALDSSGYADDHAAAKVNAPILILHGVADGPANAGSTYTAVQRARDFEAALRRAGKPVEAQYYERGEHNSIFTDPAQHDDEVRRMVTFFRRHLMK